MRSTKTSEPFIEHDTQGWSNDPAPRARGNAIASPAAQTQPYANSTSLVKDSLSSLFKMEQIIHSISDQDIDLTGQLDWMLDGERNQLIASVKHDDVQYLMPLMIIQSLRAGLLPIPELFKIKFHEELDEELNTTIVRSTFIVDLQKLQQAIQLSASDPINNSLIISSITIKRENIKAVLQVIKNSDREYGLPLLPVKTCYNFAASDQPNEYKLIILGKYYKELLSSITLPPSESTKLVAATKQLIQETYVTLTKPVATPFSQSTDDANKTQAQSSKPTRGFFLKPTSVTTKQEDDPLEKQKRSNYDGYLNYYTAIKKTGA